MYEMNDNYHKMRRLWEQVESKLDEKQGVPAGVDPDKWERCVKSVKKDSDVDNPYAVCNASLSEDEMSDWVDQSLEDDRIYFNFKDTLPKGGHPDAANDVELLKQIKTGSVPGHYKSPNSDLEPVKVTFEVDPEIGDVQDMLFNSPDEDMRSEHPEDDPDEFVSFNEERTEEERQIIDKAVQDIHTDKLQVQDVLADVPEHLRDDVLDELRRRGDDVYPERGPDGRGAGEDLVEKKKKKKPMIKAPHDRTDNAHMPPPSQKMQDKKMKKNKRHRRKADDRKMMKDYMESVSDEELMDLMQYVKENTDLVRDVLRFVEAKDKN